MSLEPIRNLIEYAAPCFNVSGRRPLNNAPPCTVVATYMNPSHVGENKKRRERKLPKIPRDATITSAIGSDHQPRMVLETQ